MKQIKVALAGNPNAGKSTIFNNLTGHRQHIGNWPGVTVDKLQGDLVYRDHELLVTDLPGIYSLTAYSIDEKIARDFIVTEKPDVVVSVVDASNLERNLYLVAQILELGANVVLDLNMMDLAEERGIKIDREHLSKVLDVKLCSTVAKKGKGTEELKEAIAQAAARGEREPLKIDYGNDIEEETARIEELIKDRELPDLYPVRWLIIKLLEGDAQVMERVRGLPGGEEILEITAKSVLKLEKHFGYEVETALIERRYGFLEGVVRECMKKEMALEERHEISDRIDKVIINRYLGVPIFLGFMYLAFQIVYTLGEPFTNLIDTFFSWLTGAVSGVLDSAGAAPWVSSLIGDGIIGGVGSVVIFFPNIFLLYAVIAVLEDSGYMARAAFVMDRIMHALGLHGKSFIPMIIGFGCTIPGILATRTLETRKDRILTILVLPLISCSARLPIYILFAGTFFKKHQGIVVFSMYLIGILLAVGMARVFKTMFFRREDMPLIMEMPPYRMPTFKPIIVHSWERSRLFLKKAGTVILAGAVVIWILASLPAGVDYASRESFIGHIGSVFAPLLEPAGFGTWQAAVSLISGIVAKEVVVGTLGTIYGAQGESLGTALAQSFTPLSAYAFMLMSLVYIPCIASIAAIKMEAGWKWMFLAVGYTLVLGWVLATAVYQVGMLVT